MMKIRNKGNLTLEFAVLMLMAIMALLVMQFYMRRALCGRWRQAADAFGHGRQYEAGVTTIN